jgi:hypothetical protein
VIVDDWFFTSPLLTLMQRRLYRSPQAPPFPHAHDSRDLPRPWWSLRSLRRHCCKRLPLFTKAPLQHLGHKVEKVTDQSEVATAYPVLLFAARKRRQRTGH